ncbi:MFS transporter [Alicyclobacillus sp. SO9]|uniref:MFS transporter n=1 Tax=Alicyclobacillus sp. SO9 TaxID=2665646 RepID=UPI0018E79353|nr:MFS transporter [Alicyclobacillus sp. SO9]QQE77622.1 MFS transporter [Alicyclobacillus sp. SO9]
MTGRISTAHSSAKIFTPMRLSSLFILGLSEFVRGALLFFILPIYVRGVLGLSPSIVGYALAAHYAVDTALRGPAGWLTDKFGQRNVLLIALGLGWIGLWSVVRAQAAMPLIIGSALFGTGMATVWPVVISRVTSGLPQGSHATAMGSVFSAWLVGVGIGTVSMAWLLGNHVRAGFTVLLLVWVAAALIAMITMSRPKIRSREEKAGEGSSTANRLSIHTIVAEARDLRLLFPGMFVQTFALGLLLPVFVLYVRYQLGLSGQTYSYLLLLGGTATVLLQIPLGRMIDRLGYKAFLLSGFVLAACTILVLVHLHTLIHVALAVIVLGAAYALILPSWNSVIANSVSQRRRAVMWGIFMTVEGLGMALGPFLGGQLWTWLAPSAPFYLAAFILIFMSFFYGFAPLQRLFRQREVEEKVDLNKGRIG